MALAQVAAGARAVITHVNQYYELLKGVSGETITLIYNAAPSIKIQPSSDPAASTDAIQVNNNAGTVLAAITYDGKFEAADGAAALPGHTFDDDPDTGLYRSAANTLDVSAGGTRTATFDANGLTLQSKALLQAKGADVASAAALAIGTDGNYFAVTGTTTITSIATRQAGTVVALRFDGALTLTHNATSLILQGATNLTTAAGDVLTFVSEGSGNWRELSRRLAAASSSNTNNEHSFRYEPLTTAGINVTNVGSGSTTALGVGRGQGMATGTTNPSSTSQRINLTGSGATLSRIHRVRRIEFQSFISDTLASANAYLYITVEDVNTVPTATPRHFGVKNLNGIVSFTTADGTTEQVTDVTAFITAAQVHAFVITFDGTTARLYIDGTLRATHATNVPGADAAPVVFRAFIDNNASVNARSLGFFSCEITFASS